MITRCLVFLARCMGDTGEKPITRIRRVRNGDYVNEEYLAAIMEAQK